MAGGGGVEERSGWRRFNGGMGVLVAREGSDGVLQMEEEMGDEGRLMAEGDDDQGWELTEGGSRRRRSGYGEVLRWQRWRR
jgi:hypothetical protein